MKILVTGGSGFLGSALVSQLKNDSQNEVSISLRKCLSHHLDNNVHVTGNISFDTDWRKLVINKNVVIHTAAMVHQMRNIKSNPQDEYRKTNVFGTVNLAKQAADAGVSRFVFISSIKVNGEFTTKDSRFTSLDAPAPQDDYAISKFEAERELFSLGSKTGMEIVVIRPPLIYGYGVKGNFSELIKLVRYGIPLPLGGINNLRSFIGLDNLVDLIIKCTLHPSVANKVVLASDGNDISTTTLLYSLGRAMNLPLRLFTLNPSLLNFTSNLFGLGSISTRLLSSLQVDISETQSLLNWTPPHSLDEGLQKCFYNTKF